MQIAVFGRVQRQDAIGNDVAVGLARKDGKTTKEVIVEAIPRESVAGDGVADALIGDDEGKEGEADEEGREVGELAPVVLPF